MGTLENESVWSTTAATNANVDTGIIWSEGQDAATVNNSARGMMAARAKARLDQGGGLVAAGTANALTVTTNQVVSSGAQFQGLRLLVRATADNTSTTVTFAPDGLTPAPLQRSDGSGLRIGDIVSGMYLDVVYAYGLGTWRCVNIRPSGSGMASFHANKTGDQAVASTSVTTVTFGTEIYDVGSHFAANVWTPPAGTALLLFSFHVTFGPAGTAGAAHIYQDGAALTFMTFAADANQQSSGNLLAMVQCSGSNAFSARIQTDDSSYTVVSSGTYFQGTMV